MSGTLGDILRNKGHHVVKVTPNTSVLEAVHLMNRMKIGSVVVVHASQPVGIFTERDVLSRIVAECRNAAETSLFEVMTSDPIVGSIFDDIDATMRRMISKRCRHLPVVADDALVGIVSMGDITYWLHVEGSQTPEDALSSAQS